MQNQERTGRHAVKKGMESHQERQDPQQLQADWKQMGV